MKRAYAIVIEWAETNYSAYAPDVLGCIATGSTVEETIATMREALAFHFEGMQQHGEEIPEPRTHVATVEVAVGAPAAN
jgi:predicted RNase H-like HicB family nuclease